MQENEFEKKIFSEMQGFKIKPSEKVWINVEERIREKKKRRGLFFIFFLLGLALLGYWQRDYFFGENQTAVVITKPAKETITEPKETVIQNSNSSLHNNFKQEKRTSVVDVMVRKPLKLKKDKKISTAIAETIKENKKHDITDILLTGKKPEDNIQPVAKPAEAELLQNNLVTDRSLKPDSIKQNEITSDEQVSIKMDSIQLQADDKQKEDPKANKEISENDRLNDTIATTVQKQSSSQKWKWGIHFTPGISSMNNNPFSLDMFKIASFDTRYLISIAGSSPSPVNPFIPRVRPSESKAGFAFQLAGFMQKQVSSRNHLSIGMKYGYYSDNINIGTKRDYSSNFGGIQSGNLRDGSSIYSNAGSISQYTNRYHFIELPVVFQLQLNKNSSRPLYLNSGVSIGQLVFTNALLYDTAFGGVYYKNKSRFNRTQFSLSAGLAWTFFNNSKMQWGIGPVVDFHLNRMQNNPMDRNKYLLFTGIRTNILFTGKK